jgi:hypothetical protein
VLYGQAWRSLSVVATLNAFVMPRRPLTFLNLAICSWGVIVLPKEPIREGMTHTLAFFLYVLKGPAVRWQYIGK